MPVGIKKIIGFMLNETTVRPFFNRIEVKEVCRVEMWNVTDTWINLIDYLPSYASGAGDTTFNPAQATFTFYQSPHPKTNALLLLQADNIRRVAGSGNVWDIDLVYGNYIPNEMTSKQDDASGTPITNPLSRPVIWSVSSNIVQKTTYTKPNGDFIVHEHGLPITEGISYEESHTSHTFQFVVPYASFNFQASIGDYVGLVGSTATFGQVGDYWKLTAASGNEKRESFGSGNTRVTYRYIEVSVTFEYNPSSWVYDARLISRSTVQKVVGDYIPIDINGNGDRAQEPWPLLVKEDADNCFGAAYDALDAEPFAVLDTSYPQLGNIQSIVDTYGLVIP